MEPLNHFTSHVKLLNEFYEWPRTRSEYNIFFKEVFRLPEFWPELFKKYHFPLLRSSLGYLLQWLQEQVMSE